MPTGAGSYDEVPGRAAQPGTRASDADRDRVIEILRVALGDGRLIPEEFEERVGAALAARTLDELPGLTADLGPVPSVQRAAVQVQDVLRISERHGIVQRTGKWVVPRRLELRIAWSGVTIDFTEAVITHDTLLLDVKMSGGTLVVVTGPDVIVDANEMKIRHGTSEITPADPGANARLLVRMAGRMRHGMIETRAGRPD